MRSAVASAVALLAAVLTACGPTTAPVTNRGSEPVLTLRPGQTSKSGAAGLRVKFENVVSDSRCPADVVCIQAGEAVVRITVIGGDGNRRSYELRTTGATSVVHDGVTIAIEGVEPRPVSARSIRPADYRLTLRVVRSFTFTADHAA